MTIRLLYVDRSVHQAWPVARELELGRLCQESVTVAEVTMMEATCIGMVEKVDALGGDVHGPVEERHSHSGGRGWKPDIKEIERCSFNNWYMVLEHGPVEGRPGTKSPAGTIRRCSAGGVPQRLRRDAPQEVLRRRCTGGDTRPIKLEIKAEDRQEA